MPNIQWFICSLRPALINRYHNIIPNVVITYNYICQLFFFLINNFTETDTISVAYGRMLVETWKRYHLIHHAFAQLLYSRLWNLGEVYVTDSVTYIPHSMHSTCPCMWKQSKQMTILGSWLTWSVCYRNCTVASSWNLLFLFHSLLVIHCPPHVLAFNYAILQPNH